MTVTTLISPKQESFIERLRVERGIEHDAEAVSLLSTREASALIDGLLAMPRPKQAQAAPGYYITDGGEYVVVVLTKDKARTYAKRLVITERGEKKRASWDYAPGVGASVAHMTPLTVEAAAAFGHMHGFCLICTKPLSDPASVQRGVGPTCAKRLG
jgi:hypothetical protein